MELCPGGNAARQLGFDVHVNIFKFRLPLEGSRLNFSSNFLQLADRV